ncbi:MAG: ImmA/IrrE family metallo-endopeptidase [Clostridia bacterium]|nr:ImmA/IrrE family metallo-endopeptidase [Clostridia bacterium]
MTRGEPGALLPGAEGAEEKAEGPAGRESPREAENVERAPLPVRERNGDAAAPPPEEERRGQAVRLACRVLLANEVRLLPPDPVALAAQMGFLLVPMLTAARLQAEAPYDFLRKSVGEEACTLYRKGRYIIAYDETVASPERIRFSIFHEFGHILMDHFRRWDPESLPLEAKRVLEDEANTFARNFLCPPPILDWVRGDPGDGKWAKLFCMSERAWRARVRTLAVDRRYIDQETADALREQFRDYMFGRRCRDCGAVFTDAERRGRCPECGCRALRWNPQMETREQAAAHRHIAGAAAEDLRPRVGEGKDLDLTGYWKLTRAEARRGKDGPAPALAPGAESVV